MPPLSPVLLVRTATAFLGLGEESAGAGVGDGGESTGRIQAALRHASPEMTRRYEMQKARKDVAAAVGRALKGA